jgi:hypothetical protein
MKFVHLDHASAGNKPHGGFTKATIGAIPLALAFLLASFSPAHAGISVNAGGSAKHIKSIATTSHDVRKIGQKLTGTGTITFEYKILGIPLPSPAYYANSFPTTFKQPSLKTVQNAELNSQTYKKFTNTHLKTKQWEVQGKTNILGTLTVKIIGDSKAQSKASSGKYFYAGTYTCGAKCHHRHSYVRVITK